MTTSRYDQPIDTILKLNLSRRYPDSGVEKIEVRNASIEIYCDSSAHARSLEHMLKEDNIELTQGLTHGTIEIPGHAKSNFMILILENKLAKNKIK